MGRADEFAAKAKVISLHGCQSRGDDFSVVISTAELNLMPGITQVGVPPVEVDAGSVVEDVQIVSSCLAPVNACLWLFESSVFDRYVAIPARFATVAV